MGKRVYLWFVEPTDEYTKSVICRLVPGDNYWGETICEDAEKHRLWECPQGVVTSLLANKKKFTLCFNVFFKKGDNAIKQWNLRERKKELLRQATPADLAEARRFRQTRLRQTTLTRQDHVVLAIK